MHFRKWPSDLVRQESASSPHDGPSPAIAYQFDFFSTNDKSDVFEPTVECDRDSCFLVLTVMWDSLGEFRHRAESERARLLIRKLGPRGA